MAQLIVLAVAEPFWERKIIMQMAVSSEVGLFTWLGRALVE
jgi:hypothetical protein